MTARVRVSWRLWGIGVQFGKLRTGWWLEVWFGPLIGWASFARGE